MHYSNITSATRTLCYKINPGVRVSILHINSLYVDNTVARVPLLLNLVHLFTVTRSTFHSCPCFHVFGFLLFTWPVKISIVNIVVLVKLCVIVSFSLVV